jgi:hypothetical protein
MHEMWKDFPVKKVRVNRSILAAGNDNDGSLSDLVGREGVVVGSHETYKMVRLDTGAVFPFEKHELTEVRTDVFPI